MGRRLLVVLAVAATAPFVVGSGVSGSAAPQKITVSLSGDCEDRVMDEGEDDADCTLQVTVTPKSPTRSFTFQEATPGAKKWATVKKVKVSTGKASFKIDELDDEGLYRDGKFSFRVTTPAIKGKQKAYISPTLKVDFIPAGGDDFSDDFTDDDSTTQTTAKPTTATKPTTPTGGSTAATTTTTLAATHGGGATDTTVASGTNGGTPTNTTAPGNEDVNWWGGVAPTTGNLGAFCDSNDPTMYVGATICSSTGIGGRKSVSQFKAMISTIANTAPQYKRNGFCTQAMAAFGHPLATQTSKCAEADAGR
ncbi:MAG: hypothetical protein ACKOA5_12895 [Actinomycetota bacterium]